MRHMSLTCKNHPTLRWMQKERSGAQVSFLGQFNGRIQSVGWPETTRRTDEGGFVDECDCPYSDLIRAPEDPQLAAWENLVYGDGERDPAILAARRAQVAAEAATWTCK